MPEQELIEAATRGLLEEVESLLSEGYSVNSVDTRGCTALMRAAENGHLSVVKLLLDRGAAIDRRDNLGRTALMRASRQPQREVAELLLSRGADSTIEDRLGMSAVDLAVGPADYLLSDSGCASQKRIGSSPQTNRREAQRVTIAPGKNAAENGSLRSATREHFRVSRVVGLLVIALGVGSGVWWLVETITAESEIKIPETIPLVAMGELVHAYDPHQRARPLPAPLLTPDGSVPQLPGEGKRRIGGKIPVHMVQFQLLESAKHCNGRVIRNCLNSDLNPNIKDRDGRTALSLASEHGCLEAATMLLDPRRHPMLRADVNSRDNDGRTPLMWACSRGHYGIIDLLLSKGADRKAKDSRGSTALGYMEEHFKAVRGQRIRGIAGNGQPPR